MNPSQENSPESDLQSSASSEHADILQKGLSGQVPTPPVTGPAIETAMLATLALARISGVGPRTCANLLERFGTAEAVLRATVHDLSTVDGVSDSLASRIAATAPSTAMDIVRVCQKHDIEIVTPDREDYPAGLRRTDDPPMVLYRQGNFLAADEIAIAIVGSRHATNYGLGVAENLARGLSLAGFTIVSGLARGIDQAAHRAALAAGGRTISVLGGGLLEVYPPEHKDLAKQIRLQGCLLSEAEPFFKPRGSSFPQRNRIISGMSLGVIVVEAARRSGALISARLAYEQNRDVFAVPGRIDNRMSQGCHQLIRDGATLVESVDDVLEQLGPLAVPVATGGGQTMHHPAEVKLNDQERAVLNAISREPSDIDSIVIRSGLTVPRVLATVSVLEIRKLIQRVAGGCYIRR